MLHERHSGPSPAAGLQSRRRRRGTPSTAAGTHGPALLALGCLLALGACTSAPTGAPPPGAVPAPLGTVGLRPGQLWISFDCVADDGPGQLAVIVESGSRFDIDCPADEVYLTRNLDQDHPGGPTGIRVETGPDVRWNLLIEQ
ncbi:hypothetical protein O7623_08855 [Solwaraspora sp. WMMD791]|uniref:hypothetical protein n=1 Tax=Solwaraspora sp. WMMD791 TaxID=3016086 RepID=UPI00249BF9AE|nr:hypothetical protein [Solwaraspora sp. WMMD791]WFE29279.1 hypothetical protein O7623_08855 [Solwaraspora sp. WMMD791]